MGGLLEPVIGSLQLHFEHTVLVQKGKAEILTTFKYIEQVTENTTLMVSV